MENLTEVLLKDLKKGEVFKKTLTAKKVFEKQEYNRSTKKFTCVDCADYFSGYTEIKGNKKVFIGFEY